MLPRLRHWSRIVSARLPAALPSSCALCGCIDVDALCEGCRTTHFGRRTARCACCGIAVSMDVAHCGSCLKTPPAFDATIVAADYAPPVDHLVLALKFGGRLEFAALFAERLHDAIVANSLQDQLALRSVRLPSVLTAVPLGRRRLVDRGFNQALEIAKPLAKALGITLKQQLVARTRDTSPQALLHPDERHRNVSAAFTVPPTALESINGAHVGVVDDVMTTGETLNALAATLKRSGAMRVTNLVFARTLPR